MVRVLPEITIKPHIREGKPMSKRKSKQTIIPKGSQVDPAMAKASKRQKALAVVPTQETSLIDVIARAASDPAVDVAKMEKLLEMHTKIVAKNSEDAFNIAMNRAQAKIRRIAADATNESTRGSKYATYAKLDSVLRPIYTEEGFSLSFDTAPNAPENVVPVMCYVSHIAGHTRTYHASVPSDGKGAKGGDVMTRTHAFGSGMQYGMRYLLKFIFNIAIGAEDDDGNAAGAGPKLNEEQVAEINDLIKKTDSGSGTYVSSYLGYISKLAKCTINFVEEIPASVFKDAKAVLEAKLPKAAS